MPHELAEAICELAAPPHRPCWIRVQVRSLRTSLRLKLQLAPAQPVLAALPPSLPSQPLQARNQGFPSQLLLLHVRLRAPAAGLEVVAHYGMTEDEEGTRARVSSNGALYVVPRTAAGLEAFAPDALAPRPIEWDDNGPCRMLLPTEPRMWDGSWDAVDLDLLPPAQVQAVQQAAHGRTWAKVSLPMYFDSGAPAGASVANPSADYTRSQAALKRKLAEEKRKAAAAAAAAGEGAPDGAAAVASIAAAAGAQQPDSDDEFKRKWKPMRDQAMADLHAALLAMLRQAVRWRGPLAFPVTAPEAGEGGPQA